MPVALNSPGMAVGALLYVGTLALVVWAVVDIVRQPRTRLRTARKLGWGLGAAVGWMVVSLLGGAVAALYLFVVRRRLGKRSGPAPGWSGWRVGGERRQ